MSVPVCLNNSHEQLGQAWSVMHAMLHVVSLMLVQSQCRHRMMSSKHNVMDTYMAYPLPWFMW